MKTSRWLGLVGLWAGLLVAAVAQDADVAELESQVVGVERARDDGTYMGLAVEGNALVLRFYDEEKQLMDPSVARASAWWKPVNVGGRERVVLNPSGDGLRSPARVRPPLVFSVMLTLIDDEGESAGSYQFAMRELQEASPASPASSGGAPSDSRY